MQNQLENYIQRDVNGSQSNKNTLIWDSWGSTVVPINTLFIEWYDKMKVLKNVKLLNLKV